MSLIYVSCFAHQNDLYLIFTFKMVTTKTQIKAFSMHVNYNIINNILFIGKKEKKTTDVFKHSIF